MNELNWTRVSAGHYDSTDGRYRIDTCSTNQRRWDVSVLTDDPSFDEPSWNEIACRANLSDARDAAFIDANLALYIEGVLPGFER